ncbi:MAG: tetratricopeptide repeat protein [Bryobacteraceae bacterium]
MSGRCKVPGVAGNHLLFVLFPMIAAMGQTAPGVDREVGSKACARCHAEIYRKYSKTSMSRSSGKTGTGEFRENFERAGFSDPASGAEYRVTAAPDGYRLEFSRASSGTRGQRLLGWFVGSGRVARAYLFSLDGFLFQAPVSYYSLDAKWDISPGYQQHSSIHLTRAVGTGCLQCHASRLQPTAGTEYRFSAAPFLEGGVSCERCHGPGRNHVTRMTSGNAKGGSGIVNPAKLDSARRDSVCAQCHLTGAARIVRVRAKDGDYRPGELLSDYAAYFVWTGPGAVMSANSHFEKLQQSACKRASGDGLWCGSCHDPHGEPEPARRVAFYRARCEKCHQPAACKGDPAARREAQDDCIGCHMPKSGIRDTEHAVFTDHTIPRREGGVTSSPGGGSPAGGQSLVSPQKLAQNGVRREMVSAPDDGARRTLCAFWKTPVDDRDLALAYAKVADADAGLRQRAYDLLRKAEARDPDDTMVLTQLAQLYDRAGKEDQAMALSERVVRLDPADVAAAVNLGAYYVKRGRAREAMRLWADALARSPALTGASMNLAVAQYQAGDPAAAEATLLRALEFDPDSDTARRLLAEIRDGGR